MNTIPPIPTTHIYKYILTNSNAIQEPKKSNWVQEGYGVAMEESIV